MMNTDNLKCDIFGRHLNTNGIDKCNSFLFRISEQESREPVWGSRIRFSWDLAV